MDLWITLPRDIAGLICKFLLPHELAYLAFTCKRAFCAITGVEFGKMACKGFRDLVLGRVKCFKCDSGVPLIYIKRYGNFVCSWCIVSSCVGCFKSALVYNGWVRRVSFNYDQIICEECLVYYNKGTCITCKKYVYHNKPAVARECYQCQQSAIAWAQCQLRIFCYI